MVTVVVPSSLAWVLYDGQSESAGQPLSGESTHVVLPPSLPPPPPPPPRPPASKFRMAARHSKLSRCAHNATAQGDVERWPIACYATDLCRSCEANTQWSAVHTHESIVTVVSTSRPSLKKRLKWTLVQSLQRPGEKALQRLQSPHAGAGGGMQRGSS